MILETSPQTLVALCKAESFQGKELKKLLRLVNPSCNDSSFNARPK